MRRQGSTAGLLVLLLAGAAMLDNAAARGGLRLSPSRPSASEPASATLQQPGLDADSIASTTPDFRMTLPPQARQAEDEDKEDAAALAAYAKQRAALQELHEEALATLAVAEEAKGQRQQLQELHEEVLVSLAVAEEAKKQRQQLQGLHEDMVQELGAGDADGRRLQFGVPGIRIPGVPGIPNVGIPGVGGIGVGSFYGAARAGANVLRQGVYTAVEMARLKDEYERRCGLGQYADGSSHPATRHLQQLLAQAGRLAYNGAVDYARDMPCPTAEEREEYEHMYEQALGAQRRALASLASQGDAISKEQEARMLLYRQTRESSAPPPRTLQDQQQQQQQQQQRKRPMPVIAGADILARQQQLLDAYGAAPRSEMAAALLRQAGSGEGEGEGGSLADLLDGDAIGGALAGGLMGAGGGGRTGLAGLGTAGLAGMRENAFQQFVGGDALRRAGYQQPGGGGLRGVLGDGDLNDELDEELEDDDATLESLMGPKRLGEGREDRHKRKQELRAQRKAARLARKAERKARRPHGAFGKNA